MNPFVESVTTLLKQKKITKNKLLTDLGLNKNSFVDWNKRGTIPSASVVSAIAEYLGVDTNILLNQEQHPSKFMKKLCFLLDVNCMTSSELCEKLGIDELEYERWKKGESTSYTNYYKSLSAIFDVQEKYFLFDNVIAPGIEPNEEEYFLLLFWRAYKENKPTDFYGKFENFFPGLIYAQNFEEKRLIESFRTLNMNNQTIALGEILKLQKEQETEKYLKLSVSSVAAEENTKKTGTDNLGK